MTDGLKDRHRAAIIATIAANDRVERAVLFGSRATGTHSVSSDVDIALFGDRLTLTDQARLSAVLDKFPMAQSVDLLLYDSIQDWTLREHIRRQGIEWYALPSRDESHDPASASGSEWPVVKLGEISSDEPGSIAVGPFGSRMKSEVYTPSGVPVIRGTNISKDRAWRNEWVYVSDDFADGLPNCNVREGDLVFPHRGSIGEVAIIPGDRARYMLSTSLMKFRPDPEKISPLFLFYYFRSDTGRAEIMRFSSQVGTPGIGQPLTSLRQFRVPIPPSEEQERIAGILSSIDDKIELNRRMNATLEAMARALFKSWFIDFDPVRAKMAGRDTRLPREIAELFPDRLMDSVLGEIPMGWDIGTLAQHVEVAKGVSYKGRGLGRDGIPLHNLNSVHEGGGYKYDGIKFYAGDYASRHVVRPGDVIIANTEQGHDRLLIGYAAIVPNFFGEHGICSHHLYRLRPRRNGQLSMPFLQQLLNSPMMHDLVSGYANGTTVNMLPVDAVQKPMLSIPPRRLIDSFDAVAMEIEHRRDQVVGESRTLEVIREGLLPKLVSGDLRVDAVDAA